MVTKRTGRAAPLVRGLPNSTEASGLLSLPESPNLSRYRQELIEIVHERGLLITDKPLQLASGDWSRYFVDGKAALARGSDLHKAAVALLELVAEEHVEFDAVGGLTMGADQFAHAVAMIHQDAEWFSVRKAPKDRGTKRLIEGARLGPGKTVLLVDDVVTRGGSIVDAYKAIIATGASVVCAVTLLDRGAPEAGAFFEERGVPYRPLVTHEQLGMPAVGTEPPYSEATG